MSEPQIVADRDEARSVRRLPSDRLEQRSADISATALLTPDVPVSHSVMPGDLVARLLSVAACRSVHRKAS